MAILTTMCLLKGVKLPRLKPVRITLETWNVVRKYAHICSFRKYTFQYQGPLHLADVSIFCKKSAFFDKNSAFTQSRELCLRFFNSVFSFCKIKGYYLWKCKFYRQYVWLSNCSKSAINQENDNDVTFCRHDVIISFFWRCFV